MTKGNIVLELLNNAKSAIKKFGPIRSLHCGHVTSKGAGLGTVGDHHCHWRPGLQGSLSSILWLEPIPGRTWRGRG